MMLKTRNLLIPMVLCIAMLVYILSSFVLFPEVAVASTPDWGSILKNSDSWFGSSDGIALADEIVKYQNSDGGWRKDMTGSSSGSWGKSTIDNDTTTSQIIVLAKVYKQTNNSKYLTACQKGIDLLLNGQYSNGGWPQIFNDAGTYHAHITYNDGAMINVMKILTDVSKKSGNFTFIDSTRASRARTAVEKGIDCILKTQIVVNGVKTAWCQQHDENTLKPTTGRSYELPSNSGSESVSIVYYLKTISNPSPEVTDSINSAIAWMKKVQILGIKVVDTGDDRVVVSDPSAPPIWARFYEIGTDRPIFVDRDGSKHYNMSEISQERRTGYSWYGYWPSKLVAAGPVSPAPTPSPTIIPTPTQKPTPSPTIVPTSTPTIIPTTTPTSVDGEFIKSLTVRDSANSADWSIQTNLKAGDNVFGDRTYKFVTVPNGLLGSEWIRTACDSKSFTTDLASFTTKSDVSVYVGLDSRCVNVPSWLGSWTKTGESLTDDGTPSVIFNLYKKDFRSNSVVNLGTNGTSTGVVNYTVIVKENNQSSITYGDLNGDGYVDSTDYTVLKRHILKISVLPQDKIEAADLNLDGFVDSTDYSILRRFILKVITQLPLQP